MIDLLVYHETREKGNRVFLDYTKNPSSAHNLSEFNIDLLDSEAWEYLEKSDALYPKPIDRLEALNPQAISLFRKNDVNLRTDPVEAAVCVQHNNGGLKGNIWWESNVDHLFPIGEVNGSHGVSRPGGSALNAGQVGGLRAAQYIIAKYDGWTLDHEEFKKGVRSQIEEKIDLVVKMLEKDGRNIHSVREEIQERMSECAGPLRDPDRIEVELERARVLLRKLRDGKQEANLQGFPKAFQNIHLAISQVFYLSSMLWYVREGGGSRGSYLILDDEGKKSLKSDGFECQYREENEEFRDMIQETHLDDTEDIENRWIDRRPIPDTEFWFESVWRDYENDNIFDY